MDYSFDSGVVTGVDLGFMYREGGGIVKNIFQKYFFRW